MYNCVLIGTKMAKKAKKKYGDTLKVNGDTLAAVRKICNIKGWKMGAFYDTAVLEKISRENLNNTK